MRRVVIDPLKAYAARVHLVFGWRFLVFLSTTQLILKGSLIYVVGGVLLPLFKNVLGVNAASMQFLIMIVMVPWSIKPIIGLLSDFTVVNGLRRRPWLIQSLVVGCVGAGGAILAYGKQSAIGLALCFAGVQLQISVFDLMSESIYSARIRAHDASEPDPTKRTGSDIVTITFVLQTVGGVAATLFVGALADQQAYMALLCIIAALCVTPIGPTLLGWISEERDHEMDPDDAAEHADDTRYCCWGRVRFASKSRVQRQSGMIFVIAFLGIAAPVTALVSNAGDPAVGLAVAILFIIAALVGAYAVFPRMVAHMALYSVLRTVSGPSIGTALDYWYLATDDCVPNGPAFSYTFYMMTAGLIGSAATLIAAFVYQKTMSKMSYRYVLLGTTVASSLIGSSDLFLVTRANIALGIPDRWAYVTGEAIMESLLGMLNAIPMSTLLAKVIPKGIEASSYAFLAGISNFASMIRELSGAILFDAAGVRTTVPCNFNSLPWLVLSCHVLSPLVVGICVSWLIPNVRQDADLNPVPEPESDVEFKNLIDD